MTRQKKRREATDTLAELCLLPGARNLAPRGRPSQKGVAPALICTIYSNYTIKNFLRLLKPQLHQSVCDGTH